MLKPAVLQMPLKKVTVLGLVILLAIASVATLALVGKPAFRIWVSIAGCGAWVFGWIFFHSKEDETKECSAGAAFVCIIFALAAAFG